MRCISSLPLDYVTGVSVVSDSGRWSTTTTRLSRVRFILLLIRNSLRAHARRVSASCDKGESLCMLCRTPSPRPSVERICMQFAMQNRLEALRIILQKADNGRERSFRLHTRISVWGIMKYNININLYSWNCFGALVRILRIKRLIRVCTFHIKISRYFA